MLEVVAQPQEGTRVAGVAASVRRAPLAWAAALVIVIAIGLGLLFGPGLIGNDSSPTPAPSLPPTAPFTSAQDGYELLIPASWEEAESGFADARRWVGHEGELMISYGSSIFDRGLVTMCLPPFADAENCFRLQNDFSIPLQRSDYTGPIGLDVQLDQCDGGCPITRTDTTLGLEPAGQDHLVMRGRDLTYVTAFHDYRPIIIVWSEPASASNPALVKHMLESFRFLDPDPQSSASPFADPTRLVTFADQDAGYEILMPGTWAGDTRSFVNGTEAYPGVRKFGFADDRDGAPALVISIGEQDGSVYLCRYACRGVTAATVEELEAALVSVPEAFVSAVDPEKHGELLLGTDIGRFEKPGYNNPADIPYGLGPISQETANCLGCPGMLYHAYTIHDGRPVVLAFDFWNIAFERISVDYLVRMLESFRWLDEPAGTGIFPGAGFSIRLPTLWKVVRPSAPPGDPNVIYFEKGARSGDALFSLTVIAGDEDGSVRTCITPRIWEVCQQLAPASLEELALATYEELHVPALGLAPTVAVRDTTIDGEPAMQVEIDALTSKKCCLYMVVPEHADYMVVIHKGRPFVLRFLTIIGGAREVWFDELLADFHFLD